MTSSVDTTVAIIGGGPVGLTLAALLGMRGVSVTVVESATDVFPLPRAAHLDHTVLRVMHEMGCLDEVLPGMQPNTALVLADELAQPLVTIPATGIGKSGFPASMYFYQPDFDRTLERVARATDGVEVMRGLEMTSYEQTPDHVTVHCQPVGGGEPLTIEAEWIIGCDGASSPVRETWGIGLDSLQFDERWLVLDLLLAKDGVAVPGHALQVCDPARPWVSNPVPGGRYRVEARLYDDDDVVAVSDPDFLRTFLRPLLGDAQFTIERDAVYTFHGLAAHTWRVGRALIAGDAAHQMPPFLGQGMVSGIRDAHNLAWKLAGVVDGIFSADILDTYQEERDPHIRKVTRAAIEVGRFVSVSDAREASERNAALRAGNLSNIPSFRIPDLEPGTLIHEGGGGIFPQPVATDGHPTLDRTLGTGMAVVSIDPVTEDAMQWWRDRFGAVALTVDQLGSDGPSVRAWLTKQGTPVVVVRPDRYVLAAGTSLDNITDTMKSSVALAAS